ncbi:hypothetical protein [Falsirhodobacter sp. 20TX0035]|uniref:hypothetical protein n=1 Tax=Falsirhodobacter sp. 20TX0035 TaxID=3022019 RepID=UPI00232DFE16|nr:hypothetical protein [Falsirhodobacter sp. 20TX0035]MDB6455044.1 hypothetical protein [Falsirhodobacter sp. 20TX0035]
MPKLDLTTAKQIKGAAGEVLALKGSGFAWAKPMAWTPASIADASWVDMTDASRRTLTNGRVSRISPRSGTIGLAQTVVERQPGLDGVIAGKAVPRFATSPHQLAFDAVLPNEATIVAILQCVAGLSPLRALVGFGLDDTTSPDTVPIVPIGGQNSTSTAWQRYRGVLTWRVNGVLVSPATRAEAHDALFASGKACLQEMHFTDTWLIRALGGSRFDYRLGGDIAEVVIVPRALTAAERSNLSTYAQRYMIGT